MLVFLHFRRLDFHYLVSANEMPARSALLPKEGYHDCNQHFS